MSNEWYKRGEVKDFNQYINLDEKIEVIPANNLAVNKLNFGDTLDQDYISQQFSKEANREYGKTYYVDTENFFSQGTFEVKTGFVIKRGDLEDYVKKLGNLINNKELRMELSSNGWNFVKEKFNYTRLTRDMEDLYRKLLVKNAK